MSGGPRPRLALRALRRTLLVAGVPLPPPPLPPALLSLPTSGEFFTNVACLAGALGRSAAAIAESLLRLMADGSLEGGVFPPPAPLAGDLGMPDPEPGRGPASAGGWVLAARPEDLGPWARGALLGLGLGLGLAAAATAAAPPGGFWVPGGDALGPGRLDLLGPLEAVRGEFFFGGVVLLPLPGLPAGFDRAFALAAATPPLVGLE